MDYKEKLIKWNGTEKYKMEVDFLSKLIGNGDKRILDYGCGLGHTAKKIGADGYDVNNYCEADINYYTPIIFEGVTYRNLPAHDLDDIYFMHSLSHIHDAKELLTSLRTLYFNVKITVITPNAYWLMLQKNPNYKPDPTVVKHYTQTQLKELFEQAGYEIGLIGQFGDETNGVNERIFLQTK